MTFSNWNTSFLLERVAALEILPNFDRKSNTPAHLSRGVIHYTIQQPSSIRNALLSPFTVTEVISSAA